MAVSETTGEMLLAQAGRVLAAIFKIAKIPNFLSPTHTPPPLSRPAGRKRGAFNSPFGRVFEVNKFLTSANLHAVPAASGRMEVPTHSPTNRLRLQTAPTPSRTGTSQL